MKFLIFGGTGFIGSQLRQLLIAQGHEVEATSRSGVDGTLKIDITDPSSFNTLTVPPDIIVNAASLIPQASKSSTDPEFLQELYLTNVIGGVNICNWAVAQGIKKILNLSTLVTVRKPWPVPLLESAIALPEGPHVGYAMSKLSQEQLMNQAASEGNLQVIHLRLSAVYGPTMSPGGILFFLLNSFSTGDEIRLTNGTKMEFDFIHVEDVCRTILSLSEENVKENILNVASGNSITLLALAEKLKSLLQSEHTINNTNIEGQGSRANVSVQRLEKYTAGAHHATSLETGLLELINSYSK